MNTSTDYNRFCYKNNINEYIAIHNWVRSKLGNPKICLECGTNISLLYDWANISGEYLKDIKDWKRLCRKCHKKFDYDTIVKGEDVCTAKLTEEDVLEIRKLYVKNVYGFKKLARQFNVTPSCICLITQNRIWKHLLTKELYA